MAPESTHEHRISRLEDRVDKNAAHISDVSREHAVTREALRIFEYAQKDLRECLEAQSRETREVKNLLQQHIADENKDRARLLAGVITAALSGLGTVAVLIWGVWELLHGVAP